jgi:hypothetical protein
VWAVIIPAMLIPAMTVDIVTARIPAVQGVVVFTRGIPVWMIRNFVRASNSVMKVRTSAGFPEILVNSCFAMRAMTIV